MPMYDYRCLRCQGQFEALRGVTATAPPCPHCGGSTERLILSAPAIHGAMARGRELAAKSLPACGEGCRCCP